MDTKNNAAGVPEDKYWMMHEGDLLALLSSDIGAAYVDPLAAAARCNIRIYPVAAAPAPNSRQSQEKCPACGGNDADAPCAYPSGGKAGCLRDTRLSPAQAQPAGEVLTDQQIIDCFTKAGVWLGVDQDNIARNIKAVRAALATHSGAEVPSRDDVLEEVAEKIESMNDSAGDRAAYENRDMLCCEEARMWALRDCANGVRALKSAAAPIAASAANEEKGNQQ